MKRYMIILFCLLVGGSTVSAKIWRVNNNAGVARDYDKIADAVTAAGKGDTIHIEGSVTTYNEVVTVSKRLYIFGPGFYLTTNPETQHIKQSAKVGNITFIAGSGGSVLAGIEQIANTNVVRINTDTIKVVNCRLYSVEIQNNKALQNIDIRKCWMDGGKIVTATTTGAAPAVTNLNITNNFFNNATTTIILHDDVKALISNNTFYGVFVVTSKNSGTSVTNNVFFRTATSTLNVQSANVCTRNLYNQASLGGMENNVQNNTLIADTDPLKWFSGSGGVNTVDRYFTAKNGSPSPLYDAASSGAQLGMFGGLSPYELSGMTNIPSVYEIVMPSEVSSDGFDVTVKVKAH